MSKEIIKALTDINKELSINKKLCDNLMGIDKKISALEKSLSPSKSKKITTVKQIKEKNKKPIELLIDQEGLEEVKEALGELEVDEAIKESTIEIKEKPVKKKPVKKKPVKKKPVKKKPVKKKPVKKKTGIEKAEDFLTEDIVERKSDSNDKAVLENRYGNKKVVDLVNTLLNILGDEDISVVIEYGDIINDVFEDDSRKSKLATEEKEGLLDVIKTHMKEANNEILNLLRITVDRQRIANDRPEEETQLIIQQQPQTQTQSTEPTRDEQVALNVLGLPFNASASEVRRRYKQLAKQHHPDKGGDPENFRRLNNIYKNAEKYVRRRGGSFVSDDEINNFIADVHREIRGGILNMVNPFSKGGNLYDTLLNSTQITRI